MDSITYETKYYSLPPAMRIIFDKIDEIVRSQTKLKAEISSIIEQTNSYDTSAAEKTKCCLKRLKTKTDQLLPVIDFLSSQINTSIAATDKVIESTENPIKLLNHFKTENFVREQIAFLQKEVDHCELNLWPASKATGIEDGEQSEISAADFIIVLEAQREAMQKLANEAFEIERRVNSLEEKE